jgi:L-lactate permease
MFDDFFHAAIAWWRISGDIYVFLTCWPGSIMMCMMQGWTRKVEHEKAYHLSIVDQHATTHYSLAVVIGALLPSLTSTRVSWAVRTFPTYAAHLPVTITLGKSL